MKVTEKNKKLMEQVYQILLERDVRQTEIRRLVGAGYAEVFLTVLTTEYPIYEYNVGGSLVIGLMEGVRNGRKSNFTCNVKNLKKIQGEEA